MQSTMKGESQSQLDVQFSMAAGLLLRGIVAERFVTHPTAPPSPKA